MGKMLVSGYVIDGIVINGGISMFVFSKDFLIYSTFFYVASLIKNISSAYCALFNTSFLIIVL